MHWDNLLFLHWRVDPKVMRRLVPMELELDLFDGSAWVGLVPFRMAHCSFRGVPALPGLTDFYECNVRTYVTHRGPDRHTKGVWFFSLDAQTLLPVLGGRWLWSLNYVYSRFTVSRTGDTTDYALARRTSTSIASWKHAHTHIRWRTGDLFEPDSRQRPGPPDTLQHFLTERYWLFSHRGGRIWAGQVRHEPWPLRHAELLHLDDSLIVGAGLKVEGVPVAFASEHLEIEGYSLHAI